MLDIWMLYAVVILALIFDYVNGFHDTANAIATCVSTRAISPSHAVWMAAVMNFLGAMYSTGVAKTIGGDIVKSADMVSQPMIVAALLGAILWNLGTWWFGIPSSSSHALVGGVLGALLAGRGWYVLNLQGIQKIVLALILSPVVALITGGLVMVLLLWLFGRNSPRVLNSQFRKMQLLSASLMSFSHGSNDAQKSMGIITLALLSASQITSLEVPNWVKLACSLAMACGTAAGGWKIIKTMGTRIFPMEPINGFAADINSSMIILMATFFHLPVSTTHVVSGSIMGVGSAKRVTAVRWGVAQQMGYAWVMTIPSSAAVSGLIYCLFTLVPR